VTVLSLNRFAGLPANTAGALDRQQVSAVRRWRPRAGRCSSRVTWFGFGGPASPVPHPFLSRVTTALHQPGHRRSTTCHRLMLVT
jgi:hypothetical protein